MATQTAPEKTEITTQAPASALPDNAAVAKALNAEKVKVRDTRKEGKAIVPTERAVKPDDILAIAKRGGVIRATLIDGRKHEVAL